MPYRYYTPPSASINLEETSEEEQKQEIWEKKETKLDKLIRLSNIGEYCHDETVQTRPDGSVIRDTAKYKGFIYLMNLRRDIHYDKNNRNNYNKSNNSLKYNLSNEKDNILYDEVMKSSDAMDCKLRSKSESEFPKCCVGIPKVAPSNPFPEWSTVVVASGSSKL